MSTSKIPSASQKFVAITFPPGWLVFALTELCHRDCIGRTKFHLQLQFASENLQNFDPTCLKFPLKALLLSWLSAQKFWYPTRRKFAQHFFSDRIECSRVLVIISVLNGRSPWNLEYSSNWCWYPANPFDIVNLALSTFIEHYTDFSETYILFSKRQ